MKTRDDMIHDLAELLGDHATREDAELLFDHLWANGMIRCEYSGNVRAENAAPGQFHCPEGPPCNGTCAFLYVDAL